MGSRTTFKLRSVQVSAGTECRGTGVETSQDDENGANTSRAGGKKWMIFIDWRSITRILFEMSLLLLLFVAVVVMMTVGLTSILPQRIVVVVVVIGVSSSNSSNRRDLGE
jgi:uncharacterized protein involved in exopolysaccharide biosynthesis